MDRRTMLTGLATLIAVPAFAQTNPSGSGRGAAPMSPTDLNHAQRTLQLGLVALETSRIGQQKAQSADLKRFAAFEIDEQTTLSEVLGSMMDPGTTAATGGTRASQLSAATAPAAGMPIDPQGRDMVQKLKDAQAGAASDREYLQGQMQGHQALLQVQETYLQSKPQNREHLTVALQAQGRIREHLALLQAIQSKLG